MSAAMALPIETVKVFVRLLDEGADVWRPVTATRLSAATFLLNDDPAPSDEVWAFQPGHVVVAEHHDRAGWSATDLVVVAKASEIDEQFVRAGKFAAE